MSFKIKNPVLAKSLTRTSTDADKFRWAVVSDIHAGCKRISTAKMLCSLRKYLPESKIAELDMIVIAGDMFDDLLSLNNEDVFEIDVYIAWLCRKCKEHNVALRVLEGTPSHDWTQPARVAFINDTLAQIGADVQYIDTLSIVYEPRFEMNFLYVPDEVHPNPAVILDQVKELMAARNITQVDFAFMHGQFEFQLPDIVRAPKHDSNAYMELVKYVIFIGHIHTMSIHEKIFAQGSFDRTGHGQPEDKGYFVGTLDRKTGLYNVEFIINHDAHVFETIDCLGLSAEESIAKVLAFGKDAPEGSSIRIHSESNNPLFANMSELIIALPHCRITKKEESVRLTKHELRLGDTVPVQTSSITPSNVVSLLTKRFSNYRMDEKQANAVTRQLNVLMGTNNV